ncbi:hypothetical protein Bbelb_002930 [Branchiostoma belcheri]|nr:hypothetical protein Bbelb_002930 [Branchiostoma belcheri]
MAKVNPSGTCWTDGSCSKHRLKTMPNNITYSTLSSLVLSFNDISEIHWISRLRKCVTEHRKDGCVNTFTKTVKKCMLSNCNFHRNGVVIILDVPENADQFITRLRHNYVLKCSTPSEWKGKFLRDISLPTPSSLDTEATTKATITTEPQTTSTSKAYSSEEATIGYWNRTTVFYYNIAIPTPWKKQTAAVLSGTLAVLLLGWIVHHYNRCKKRRQEILNNVAAGLPLQAVADRGVSNRAGHGGNHVIGHLQQLPPAGNVDPSLQNTYEEIKDEDMAGS